MSKNPFAVVVMAHLKTLRTSRSLEDRFDWKLRLVKSLYEKGYSKKDILELFRFIDWLMKLPDDLDRRFDETLTQYEEEKKMPYVTSVERIGIQKGIQLGIEQGIEQGIQRGIEQGIRVE